MRYAPDMQLDDSIESVLARAVAAEERAALAEARCRRMSDLLGKARLTLARIKRDITAHEEGGE